MPILGPDGRPITAAAPPTRAMMTKELGAGGVSVIAGVLNDDEHVRALQGLDGVRVFDKMRRIDGEVAAVLASLQLPILAADMVVDRPEDEEIASKVTDEHIDFVRRNLTQRTDFQTTMRHVLSSMWAGYAWFEKTYVVDEGKLWLSKLAPRMATTLWRWQVDETGDLVGIVQRVHKGAALVDIEIPRAKLALFSFGREANDWGGISALRSCYRNFLINDAVYKLDAIRIERFAVGVPVFSVPAEHTDDQIDLAKEMGKHWRGAEQSYVVLVGDMGFEIASMSGSEAIDVLSTIKHHNEQIAKSVLAQFINLGTTDSGSRSLGESMMEFFYDAVEGHAKSFAGQINTEVVWPLLDLNFAGQPRPEVRFENIGSVALPALADGLAKLQGFITKDEDTESFLRRRYGLPPKSTTPPEVVETEEEPDPENQIPPVVPGPEEPVMSSHGHVRLKATGFWRELTTAEGFVSLRQIDARLDDGRDAIVSALIDLREEIAEDLVGEIRRAWKDGPAGFTEVSVPERTVQRAASAVLPELEELYDFGRQEVRRELGRQAKAKGRELTSKRGNVRTSTILRRQAVTLRDEGLTADEISELMAYRAGKLATRLSAKTMEAALAIAAGRWRTQGGNEPTGEDLNDIMEAVFSSVEREAQLVANMSASEALNLGRDFEAQRLKEQIDVAIYSSVLDDNSCNACRAADGEEAQVGSEDYYDLTPPLNSSRLGPCEGGNACRCIWVYVLLGRDQRDLT